MPMNFSRISAPLACSAMLHVAALHFGWAVYASSNQAAAPWRSPVVLRARLSSPDKASAPRLSSPSRPPQAPQSAPTEVAAAKRQAQVRTPSPPAVAPEPAPAPAEPEQASPAAVVAAPQPL